jgi:hypothetical protein
MAATTRGVALTFAANIEVFSQAPPAMKIKRQKMVPPPRPDRQPNQYFLFCQQRRTELQAEHPTVPSREVTRMLGEEWRNLSDDAKAVFAHQYQQNMENARDEPEGVVEGGRRRLWIQLQTQSGQFVSIPAFYEI